MAFANSSTAAYKNLELLDFNPGLAGAELKRLLCAQPLPHPPSLAK